MINEINDWLVYRNFMSPSKLERIAKDLRNPPFPIYGEKDVDLLLRETINSLDFSKTGIMLSGGIDSALIASYCPKGTLAFTITYPEIDGVDESKQAKMYADLFGLRLIKVPVTFQDVLDFQDDLMLYKREPLSPIEIAIHKICLRALDFGLENLLTGMGADCLFGGLTDIMSKSWNKKNFIKRYTFVPPECVLKNPHPNYGYFDPYENGNEFDANSFMEDVFGIGTSKYFLSACGCAGINLIAPYERCRRMFELNIDDMLNGNEKRILRNLFFERTGGLKAPKKYPLPRPVQVWKQFYGRIINDEFLEDAYERCATDNQRWLVFSLDHWLYLYKNNCFRHFDVGYTTGVYDMFHIGHLNLLRRASKMCDKLIVGVTTDDLVSYKNKTSIIRFEDRIRIVRSLPFVFKAVEQNNMDKVSACKRYGAHAIVVGDDWKNTDKWNKYENDLAKIGVTVVYLPYTKRVSSTILREEIKSAKNA